MATMTTDRNDTRSTTSTTNYRRTLSASTLIGDSVKNREGENLGNLKEIMLDVQSGRIAYGVLESGSVLGMGGKLFAIPFEAFTVDEQNHKLILNVDKETIKSAEGFDKNNWPDTADPQWAQKIHSHYAYNSYLERR